jgi:hypothetical protein
MTNFAVRGSGVWKTEIWGLQEGFDFHPQNQIHFLQTPLTSWIPQILEKMKGSVEQHLVKEGSFDNLKSQRGSQNNC